MIRYVLQRVVAALVTIWVTTVAVTLLIHAVPGDPVRIMYAKFQSTPEQIEAANAAVRAEHGRLAGKYRADFPPFNGDVVEVVIADGSLIGTVPFRIRDPFHL